MQTSADGRSQADRIERDDSGIRDLVGLIRLVVFLRLVDDVRVDIACVDVGITIRVTIAVAIRLGLLLAQERRGLPGFAGAPTDRPRSGRSTSAGKWSARWDGLRLG